jgi:hypothetical protein
MRTVCAFALVIALVGCGHRATPGEAEMIEGYLCSSTAMQAAPWLERSGELTCTLDAYLSDSPQCSTSDVQRLCTDELSQLTTDLPWGQRVSLEGHVEEAELCGLTAKGAAPTCSSVQRFVPDAFAP